MDFAILAQFGEFLHDGETQSIPPRAIRSRDPVQRAEHRARLVDEFCKPVDHVGRVRCGLHQRDLACKSRDQPDTDIVDMLLVIETGPGV